MPNARRRYKTFQAETGTSYQYFFAFERRVVRPEGQGAGRDFAFVITADQRAPFVVRVFLADRGIAAWERARGQELSCSEQYAAAKLRLFRAFDEERSLDEKWLDLVVDETNLEDLLGPLLLTES